MHACETGNTHTYTHSHPHLFWFDKNIDFFALCSHSFYLSSEKPRRTKKQKAFHQKSRILRSCQRCNKGNRETKIDPKCANTELIWPPVPLLWPLDHPNRLKKIYTEAKKSESYLRSSCIIQGQDPMLPGDLLSITMQKKIPLLPHDQTIATRPFISMTIFTQESLTRGFCGPKIKVSKSCTKKDLKNCIIFKKFGWGFLAAWSPHVLWT